jgi:mannose-6-phosphate isomerase-like protein (cupin superfamily)
VSGSQNDGVIDLDAVAAGIDEPWRPVDVVVANDVAVRMAKLDGEFPWHRHAEDEIFVCWSGSFRIEAAGGEVVVLRPGQMFIVPSGVEHRPVADEPAVTLLIENPATKQYGDFG